MHHPAARPPRRVRCRCAAWRCARRSAPVAYLPILGRPTVAVRFSPVFYRLPDAPPSPNASPSAAPHPWEALPYRMVFAVASLDSVMVHDTHSMAPLALVGGLHMAAITDLSWSPDGNTLAVSSMVRALCCAARVLCTCCACCGPSARALRAARVLCAGARSLRPLL